MTTKTQGPLPKILLLTGALFIGWAAHAQSTDNNISTDTARRGPMHRQWDRSKGPGGEGFHGRDGARGGFRGGSEGPGWAGRGGKMGRHGEGIRYTPEQRRQIMAINKEYHQKAADLFTKDNSTLKEYKAGLIALQKEKKAKMEALVTPEQKEQLARRRKMAAENAQVMAAARMERLKLRLNLSDDQVSKIKAGQENLHNQVKAIHENDNLLPQQKMEQMKGLMAKRKDIFKSVLTPEQLSKFEQMEQHHRGPGRPGERGERGERRPVGNGMREGSQEESGETAI
jgi:Spy/CpxP family protein refolding chaperone